MTRRERVRAAIRYEKVDRTPMDLGSMRSTGISAFSYPKLIEALGLPPRLPRVFDPMQMLALPDPDLLDALDIDVSLVELDGMNTFADEQLFTPYTYNGRLPALVRDLGEYSLSDEGTVLWHYGDQSWRMPDGAHFFEQEHGGEPFDLSKEILLPDLKKRREELEKGRLTDRHVKNILGAIRTMRDQSDRAINLGAYRGTLGFPGGMANWSMVCMLHPDAALEYFDLIAEYAIADYRLLLSELSGLADIITVSADDQGTQENPLISPELFERIYVPSYRRINDAIHEADPEVKTFLHSCGAIYDLIGSVARAGFDILNPVQWNAGGHGYEAWKQRAVNERVVLWGGGINTQVTLPFGSLQEIRSEIKMVRSIMQRSSGWVFCPIHNIMADIEPERILCMYESMKEELPYSHE